ncbi:MAG: porin PorA family protein, partial [Nocardioides sp.]|uniref:porin PorA family protein n=1 Tax=Nocardioides sp. TaxID=35761 RepID=UPI003265FE07
VLDLNLGFTEDQVASGIKDAKDNKSQIDLITGTVPLVGFIGGILAILAGAFLVFAGRKDEKA